MRTLLPLRTASLAGGPAGLVFVSSPWISQVAVRGWQLTVNALAASAHFLDLAYRLVSDRAPKMVQYAVSVVRDSELVVAVAQVTLERFLSCYESSTYQFVQSQADLTG
jgi:hypothetical protein